MVVLMWNARLLWNFPYISDAEDLSRGIATEALGEVGEGGRFRRIRG